jgi:surface antigen
MKQAIKTISVIALLIGSLNVFALDSKEGVGAVVGGVVGGVIGNQIGGGSGNAIATGIGIIVGAAVGSSIGASLDRQDQLALRDAQQDALYAPIGTPVDWDGARYGSRTGARGRFVATRQGYHRQYVNETCRSYRSEIRTRSKTEVRTGTTCRRANGTWYEVRSSEVSFY